MPKEESCSLTGVPRPGPFSADTIRVTDIDVEPVGSVATKLNVTGPTSPEPGVPESVRLALSSCSQFGDPDKAYWMVDSVEVKVDVEKMKSNGWEIRATGGTCELIGNVILGAAAILVARASSARKRTILGVSDALAPDAGEFSPNILLRTEDAYALQDSTTFVLNDGALPKGSDSIKGFTV